MKVSIEAYNIAEKILNTFDPARLKAKEAIKLEARQKTIEEKLKDMERPLPDPATTDRPKNSNNISMGQNYEKWDLIDKQITLDEEKEALEQADFSKEA